MDKTFRGKLSRIYPELDRRTRTRTAEVEVVDAVDLVPGMFARLNLTLKSEKDTIAVPSEAVIVTPKGLRVAYVVEDGKAQQRKITTGIEGGGKIQILSGIKAGDQIVVAGNEKLKDGVEVRLPGAEKKALKNRNLKKAKTRETQDDEDNRIGCQTPYSHQCNCDRACGSRRVWPVETPCELCAQHHVPIDPIVHLMARRNPRRD